MSQAIHSKLSQVRGKLGLVSMLTGIAAGVAALALLLAATMLVDWWIELPMPVRTAMLVIDVAVVGFLAFKYVIAPIAFGPDDDEVALMVEREHPTFQTRLIAAVQLTRPNAVPAGASRTLVTALVRETERMAEPVDFGGVVKLDKLAKITVTAAVVLALCVGGFAWGKDVSRDLLKRAFLSDVPVPRKTQVYCTSKNLWVAIGDPVTLSADYGGVNPGTAARARTKFESGRTQDYTLEPLVTADGKATKTYLRLIENVQESFAYTIYLNDGHSERFEVKALARPTVATVRAIQHFPAYTRLDPVPRGTGDLTILAGSELVLEVTTSAAVTAGEVHLMGLGDPKVGKVVPMALGRDRKTLTARFAVSEQRPTTRPAAADNGNGATPPAGGAPAFDVVSLNGFYVHLIDEKKGTYRIESRDEAVYPVDVVPDKDPTVRVTYPDRKEEIATQKGSVFLKFEAADDHGIGQVLLHYQADKGEDTAERTQPIPFEAAAPPRTLGFRDIPYEWKLTTAYKSPPAEGSVVTWWIEVRDLNRVELQGTKPNGGSGVSEKYSVRIVSREELERELKARTSEIIAPVEAHIKTQEDITEGVGRILLNRPSTQPAGGGGGGGGGR